MAALEVSAGRGVEAGGGRLTGETGGFALLPGVLPLATRCSLVVVRTLEHTENVRSGGLAVNGV